MRHVRTAVGTVLLAGLFLAWAMGAEAAPPASRAQDPAQLATASIVLVKVDTTKGSDSIPILFAAHDNGILDVTVDLRFYSTTCARGVDVNIPLTPSDVDLGDEDGLNRGTVSNMFLTSASGVLLGTGDSAGTWAMSALVIDLDLGTTYERNHVPLLGKQGASGNQWAGLTNAEFEDFYIVSSTIKTNLQFLCPRGNLATDMNTAASGDPSLDTSTTAVSLSGEVFDRDEGLINSIPTTCICFTENPTGILAIMALNTQFLGTFHLLPSGTAIGWRTIAFPVATAGGITIDLNWDRRIYRSVTSP